MAPSIKKPPTTLFLPFVSASPTSKAAARAKAPTADSDEAKVLAHLVAQGANGSTDDESGLALSMQQSNVSARRRGLVHKGLVRDSGRTRKTQRGCAAVVWIVRAKEDES